MTVATKMQALTDTLTPEDRTAIQQFMQKLAGEDSQGNHVAPGGAWEDTLAQAQAALPASLTAKVQHTAGTLSAEDWTELQSWIADPAGDTQGYYDRRGPSTPVSTPDPSGGALAALLLATGGAVAGVLFAAFNNNDLNFGGSVSVAPTPPSGRRPTR